jgi:leucyl/phenylalanyl-tRNA--protein transferase
VRDASKIALMFLVETLRRNNYKLLDTQYLNPHLLQFGAYEIPHETYLKQLAEAVNG